MEETLNNLSITVMGLLAKIDNTAGVFVDDTIWIGNCLAATQYILNIATYNWLRLQFSCVFKGVCDKWDKILKKDLKLKTNLSKDFPNEALYHLELYGLRTFEQVLAKNLLVSLVKFANANGILSELFEHRAIELQAASWMLWHSLKFPIKLLVNSANYFLVGATHAFKLCNLLLDGNLPDVFWTRNSIVVLDVLSFVSYLDIVISLKKYGVVFAN
ncbi:hypothetical protein G9A89_003841 [Geosiphon pyriformis]|nr:hypothetical protein G9A89_003841 [Geosiphon pyriformis]